MMSGFPCRMVALCFVLCVVLGPASGFFLTSRRSSQPVESRGAEQPSMLELLTMLQGVKEDVKDVKEDVKDLKEDVKDLKTSVDAIRQGVSQPTQEQGSDSGESNINGQLLSTFKLTSIAAEPQGDGHTVHLQLTGDPLPKVYYISMLSDWALPAPREVPVSADGSVEFFAESREMQVVLLHSRGFHAITVRLSENQQQPQQVPDIGLFLDKGTEVTFARGQEHVDVNVTLRTSGPSETSLSSSFHGINSTDPTFVTMDSGESVLQWVDSGESPVENFLTLRVNTSSAEAEGIMEINGYVRFQCDNSAQACLIGDYAITEQIPVYMTEHSGPFPPGYLGFDVEVKELRYCSLHDHYPCFLDCRVMGDRPSPVDIVRVDAGSGLQVASQFAVNTDYWSLGQMTFTNVSQGMSGRFRCSSRSQSGLGEVSRLIRLDVVYNAKITDTSVEHLDNNATEVTCQAKGSPPPDVLFRFDNGTEISEVFTDGNNAINLTYTNSDAMTKAVLRMDMELANQISAVDCVAFNMINQRTYNDTWSLYVGGYDYNDDPAVRYHLSNVLSYVVDEK